MLTRWGLANFKSIYDANLALAPLTVLTGTNSSGKSSLIQSILLVAQTLQNHFPSRTLVLNGPLIELGSFEQIMSHGSGDTMKIIIKLVSEDLLFDVKKICYEIEFKKPEENKRKGSFSPIIKRIETKITESKKTKSNDIDIVDFTFIAETISGELFVVDISPSFKEKILASSLPVEMIFNLESFEYLDTTIMDESYLNYLIEDSQLKISLNHFMGVGFIIPHKMFEYHERLASSYMILSDVLEIPEPLSNATKLLNDYFTNSFKYLGPLRFRGNLSPFSKASDIKDVGTSGEYAAAVYDLYRDEKIKYIPCQCFINEESRVLKDFQPSEEDFPKALNEWIRYLGVAHSIDVLPTDDGYKIQVIHRDSDNEVNLTHVGTGVSQVFPILVMGLLGGENSTLVFEQEELHLHPAVQTRLADFFLSMTFLKKQCIVETHSEYFITQLRYRISKALLHNDTDISQKTKIYFADKNGRESHFREIKITKQGGISEWPDGFFDERQKIDDKMFDAMGTGFEGDDDQSDY